MATLLRSLAAVLLTAILLVISLPPVGWWPLAWIALVPVLWASQGRGFLMAFLIGIGASLLLGWFAVEGFFYAQKSFDGERTWTYLGTAMFGFVLSMCCGFVGELKELNLRSTVALCCFAVLMDLALMPLLPVSFAISQSRVPGMLTLASWTGIWGVSFLLWVVNLSIASLIQRRSTVKLAAFNGIAAILIALGWLPAADRKSEHLKVSVVQSPSAELIQMSALSRKGEPDLAVWPEFAGLAHVQRGDATKLIEAARWPGMPAIVTSFPDNHDPLPFNTAALFSRQGESRRYHKRRLFGGEKNMHTPGIQAVAAETEWGPIGLNICFDSCFPNLMRESSRLGDVGLIALPTIDPPSPHGFIAAMHAAFTPFRAAELGVAVARADGYAHSMIVGNTGAVLAELPADAEDAAVATVDVTPRWTLYKAAGDWFLYLCAVLLLLIVGSAAYSRFRTGNNEAPSSIL